MERRKGDRRKTKVEKQEEYQQDERTYCNCKECVRPEDFESGCREQVLVNRGVLQYIKERFFLHIKKQKGDIG